MTQPHKDHSATKQKAPQAKQPAAPSLSSSVVAATRSRDGRPKRDAKEGRDGRRREAIPEIGGQRAPVLTETGARINRRAADRLRNGHLWVYASDVETIKIGDGDAPALLPVAGV